MLRRKLERQFVKVQTTMDDLEQYSRRNCLTFNGIQEQEDSHENTDLILVDICRKNLGVDLSWGGGGSFTQVAQTRKSSTDKPHQLS